MSVGVVGGIGLVEAVIAPGVVVVAPGVVAVGVGAILVVASVGLAVTILEVAPVDALVGAPVVALVDAPAPPAPLAFVVFPPSITADDDRRDVGPVT